MARKTHVDVLNALLSNCKQSDRNIAKLAKTSQPTVTRVRQRLEREGIIKAYMAIPDYTKLGFTFGSITICTDGDFDEVCSKYSVMLIASTISSDSNLMLITLHKTMEDYDAFLKEVKLVAEGVKSSLFTTEGLEVKTLKVSTPFVMLE